MTMIRKTDPSMSKLLTQHSQVNATMDKQQTSDHVESDSDAIQPRKSSKKTTVHAGLVTQLNNQYRSIETIRADRRDTRAYANSVYRQASDKTAEELISKSLHCDLSV